MTKIAIVQGKPVYGNLTESILQTVKQIEEASKSGAKIIVFGETWLGGYPGWIDHCPNVARWQHQPVMDAWRSIFENGLEIPSGELGQLQIAAAKYQVTLVIGINEVIKKGKGNGVIFNSIIIIDPKGKIINHHRKLMPTFSEKLIYSQGDGNGLKSMDTPHGRVGALICWEHWMPLARQVMHDEGEDIHIALWPTVNTAHQLASRHYAFEGRCVVVAVGQIMQVSDIPSQLELPDYLQNDPDGYICRGGSCVIGPDGAYLLEPQFEQAAIYYVDLPSKTELTNLKMSLSVSGHYQRHDIFQLKVNTERY
jgi:nitrilase